MESFYFVIYAIFAVAILLMLPFMLIFLILAILCFTIALPSIIVFGLLYFFYTRIAVNNTVIKIIFIIIVIIFSPILLIFAILLVPFLIVAVILYFVRDGVIVNTYCADLGNTLRLFFGTS